MSSISSFSEVIEICKRYISKQDGIKIIFQRPMEYDDSENQPSLEFVMYGKQLLFKYDDYVFDKTEEKTLDLTQATHIPTVTELLRKSGKLKSQPTIPINNLSVFSGKTLSPIVQQIVRSLVCVITLLNFLQCDQIVVTVSHGDQEFAMATEKETQSIMLYPLKEFYIGHITPETRICVAKLEQSGWMISREFLQTIKQ